MFLRTFVLVLSFVPITVVAAPTFPVGSRPIPKPAPVIIAEPAPPEIPVPPEAPPKKKKGTFTKRRTPRTPAQLVEAYMPKVKGALSARWAEAVTPRMRDFASGNLSVTFKLDADGKVTGVTVTANTTNEPFAKFCDQFLRDTKFEAPPDGALADGQLEIPFTFTIY